MATTTQTRSRRIVCSNNQLLYIRDDQRLVSWPCLGSNQHGGLRTPRRRGVSEEAEQRLRGDYMSSYFVKLRPLDFNPNQSSNF
ncbi:hypothetical protein YC2023_001657 [Brassica napus]